MEKQKESRVYFASLLQYYYFFVLNHMDLCTLSNWMLVGTIFMPLIGISTNKLVCNVLKVLICSLLQPTV